MKLCLPHRCCVAGSLAFLLFAGSSVLAQTRDAAPKTNSSPAKASVRAYPRVTVAADRELEYVGQFSSDGKYKPLTKLNRYVESMVTASTHDQSKVNPSVPPPPHPRIQSRHVTVQDFQPPAHAVDTVRSTSLVKDVRDSVINFVYGPESIFAAPQGVTTDSQNRAIITDPDAHAVHVLDSKNKASFSIIGGKGRRLQSPYGVAVDADDNIYVSDFDLGKVLVYGPDGRFVRYIGDFKGENVYQGPAGIAIDRKTGRIYLLDRPRNLLFILDLEGNELARVGQISFHDGMFSARRTSEAGHGELKQPAVVAIHNDELLVLDAGSRVQVFDLLGHFKRQFSLPQGKASGLCVDSQGTLYVSREATNTVEAYDLEGRLLNSFGRAGNRYGEFGSPAGLWADATDRLYIIDSDNLRLQIFQLQSPRQPAQR